MTHIDFSPLYVLTGKPPPLTDAAAFTSYVAKNNDIGVTTKQADTPYVAAFIVFIAACGSRSATPEAGACSASRKRPPEQRRPRDRPAADPAAMGGPGCRPRMPGPAARSVIHLATGRRQGGGDRL
jgi:hypothetical protein